MKNGLRLLAAALLVVPLFAADPSRTIVWRAAELNQRGTELAKHVGPDHSSRETLADFGHHRFRLLYRDADGLPEQHDQIVDVVIVQALPQSLRGRLADLASRDARVAANS